MQPSQVNGLSFNNNRIPSPFIPSPNSASFSRRNDFYDPSQQQSRFNFPSNSFNPYQQVPQSQFNTPPMYPLYNGIGNGYNGAQTFYPNYRPQPSAYIPGSNLNSYENSQGIPSSGYQVPHRQFGPNFTPSENRLSSLYSRLADSKPDEQEKKSE